MCLLVDTKIHALHKNSLCERLFKYASRYHICAHIADKDIVTIKYLKEITDKDGNKKYFAPYVDNFEYEINRSYEINDWTKEHPFYKDCTSFAIDYGFHSFLLTSAFTPIFLNATIVKCVAIIPKGSFYFKGLNKDIVSDKLIIKEIIGTVSKTSYPCASSESGMYRKKRRKKRNKKLKRHTT